MILKIDESSDKDLIHKGMEKKWNISADDIKVLESKGDLTIVSSSKWYLPEVTGKTLDKEGVQQSWTDLVTKSFKRGKIIILLLDIPLRFITRTLLRQME